MQAPLQNVVPAVHWKCRDARIRLGLRPLVMGVLNVTPDSFSDGGRYADPAAAVARAMEMVAEGADILDIGGESSRPGARPVPEAEERARVTPVVRAIAERLPDMAAVRPWGQVLISVDTRKAGVAEAAMDAGAAIINDISALTADQAMIAVARRYGAGVVLMHMQGTPETMQTAPHYEDAAREVAGWLAARRQAVEEAGLDPETLALDPGIGFGKNLEHNLQLLAGLERLRAEGRPVVIGVSRKSFIGRLTGRETGDRLAGSLAALVFAVLRGARVARVHDVRETVDALRVLTALMEEASACPG